MRDLFDFLADLISAAVGTLLARLSQWVRVSTPTI
jgi:hypothetical protein